MPAYCARSLASCAAPLFPDAESAEDAVEKIVSINGADQGTQLIQRAAKLQGENLRGLGKEDDGMRPPQMLQRGLDMMFASTQVRCESRFPLTLIG